MQQLFESLKFNVYVDYFLFLLISQYTFIEMTNCRHVMVATNVNNCSVSIKYRILQNYLDEINIFKSIFGASFQIHETAHILCFRKQKENQINLPPPRYILDISWGIEQSLPHFTKHGGICLQLKEVIGSFEESNSRWQTLIESG